MSDQGCAAEMPDTAYTLSTHAKCDRGEGANLITVRDAPDTAYTLRAAPGGVGNAHNTTYITDPVARTLTASYGKQVDSSDTSKGPPNLVIQETYPCLRTNPYNNSDAGMESQMLVLDNLPDGEAAAEMTAAYGVETSPVAFSVNQRREGRLRAVHGSLNASNSGSQVDGVLAAMKARRLLPIETERLQGLEDDWTRWGADGQELKDSTRYRLTGNAVAVPVVVWLAERLRRAMSGEEL